MSDQVKELLQKVDSLEKQINLVQNNVNFSLGLTWTILGVVVAIIGIALYFIVKIWVNKRVEEELPKAIENNPPILYFTGMLNKIASVSDNENNWYTKAMIEFDCERFKLKTLNFPVELSLYYLESKNFKNTEPGLENTWTTNTYKAPIIEYNASIVNNVIQIKYVEPRNKEFQRDNIFYTLKIPNPIYKNNI